MHDGDPMGDAAGAPDGPGLVGQALAIVVELAGSPARDRLSRLVRAVQGLTGADAVAVAIVGPDGRFQPGAASSEAASRLLYTELTTRTGPTITCHSQARPVPPSRLAIWPSLAGEAAAYGLSTVDALPLRAAGQSVGALTFYWSVPYAPSTAVQELTQALADITAIGLATDRTVHEYRMRADQADQARSGQAVIEQAKGFLAAYHRITVDEALSVLSTHARSSGRPLPEIATEILGHHRSHRGPGSP